MERYDEGHTLLHRKPRRASISLMKVSKVRIFEKMAEKVKKTLVRTKYLQKQCIKSFDCETKSNK